MFKEVHSGMNFPEMERKILNFWLQGQFFQKLVKKNKGKKKFSFLDGPITANNPMGVHHAWGRTYKDIFQRYKAMKGFDQRFQNGFDCQGLWVEVEVEKELGFSSKKDIEKYGIDKFVEKCKERVHKYSMVQTEQSIRLGQWMDWGEWETELDDPDWMTKSHSYYTMSETNNYTIWYFLKNTHSKGWIYKGTDVMPWCIRCGTAISDMEIATEEYHEITHTGLVIKLPIIGKTHEYLLVWTTTSWTLTSNTAVAVHPEMIYVKVRQGNDIYYIAKSRLSILNGEYEILHEFPGKELVGTTYRGPFDELPVQNNITHKVIPWKEVLETEGTGLVHIAPGCGKEDFLLGKEHKLSVVAPLDEMGFYVTGFDWLSGMSVKDVNEQIINNLRDKGLLYRMDNYLHRYPVCWRCNSELVFRLVDEWFISMNDLRYKIAEVAKKVELWIPSFGLERELDWLKNMSDWCISKKRYWGLALPIWECICGYFTVIGSKEELKLKAIDGLEEFEGHTPHRPWIDKVKIKCEKCGEKVSRIADVGNPWLDAGIVPFSTLNYTTDRKYWEEWFPADFITECFPGQFRNWFYAILTMSTVLENKTPFKVVLGHGLVRDEKGEEMHKSKGNTILFNDAADKMGADIMRWMFASQNPANNLNFGYTVGSEVKRKFLTLWNVYSFFVTYAKIDGFNPIGKNIDAPHTQTPTQTSPTPHPNITLLDRWILSRMNNLIKFYQEKFDKFETDSVTKEIETFIDDLSVWYVRRSRRRMWKSENDSDKTAAYIVLYSVLVNIAKLLAPIVPFLSEEMYQNLVCSVDSTAPESVHLCDFPTSDIKKIDEKLESEMTLTRLIVSLGRSARNNSGVKIRQPLNEMYIKIASESERLNNFMESLIKDELNIKNIKVTSQQEIDKIDKTEWSIATEGNYTVAVNTKLTEELLSEGFAREFIHKVQMLRKEANFNVSDRIKIYFKTTDKLKKYIEENTDYIKNETLAIEIADSDRKSNNTKAENINGEKTLITLERV